MLQDIIKDLYELTVKCEKMTNKKDIEKAIQAWFSEYKEMYAKDAKFFNILERVEERMIRDYTSEKR